MFPYNKILIDKGMTKGQLRVSCGSSTATIAKMGKGENVPLDVISRICACPNCQPGDLLEYVPGKE